MSNELKSLQCLVRSGEEISIGRKLTRAAIEAFLVGLGPPISFCNPSFTSSVIFMNKLVPRGINNRLSTPSDFDFGPEVENVQFQSRSGNLLRAWKKSAQIPISSELTSHGSIVYIHGSGGNRGWPLYRVKLIKILSLCGFNVFSFDYSGFGDSSGVPTQSGIDLDIISAVEKTQKIWPDDRIIIWAHSLGTGLIAHLLSSYQNPEDELEVSPIFESISGIILESPIGSLRECMVENPLGKKLRKMWGSFLYEKMIDYHLKKTNIELNTGEDILNLKYHILILQAEDDPIVSWQTSRQHFSQLCARGKCKSARFVMFESWHKYRHEGVILFPGLRNLLLEFVQIMDLNFSSSDPEKFQADVM